MAIELNPEAQQRLERYNHALLEEDGTVEHELATYMDAFLEGYNDKPHPPYHGIGSSRISPISSSRTIPLIPSKMLCMITVKHTTI